MEIFLVGDETFEIGDLELHGLYLRAQAPQLLLVLLVGGLLEEILAHLLVKLSQQTVYIINYS